MDWKSKLINFYESPQLDDMLDKICPNKRFRDDLKQELILYLLEMEQDKLVGLIERKQLLFYCYGYLKNQYQSSTSEFYKTYRNYITFEDNNYFFKILSDDANDDDEVYEKVEKFLVSKVNWFDAFLFRSYYYNWWCDEKEKTIKGLSYRNIEKMYSLSDDLKMDHMYVYNSVKLTMKSLKKELGI
jgi:hypothetical protein